METDPIGYAGGINLYGYVGNNPWNWVDPWGLDRITDVDAMFDRADREGRSPRAGDSIDPNDVDEAVETTKDLLKEVIEESAEAAARCL